MAHGGRPVERPAHLSPEQRQQAQQRTREWRTQCGLSQKDMAAEINVSVALYRTWENGKDPNAGPTRPLTDQLSKTLRRLLEDRYADGEAFDVWGWPREQDMSYEQVAELLRSTGFDLPRLRANGQPPAMIVWVHKVRPWTLVHGVFSLAAAAITRAGVPVHLLLDDVSLLTGGRHQEWCGEFESRVREWVTFASGDDAKLTTRLYSAVLTDEYLAERGWSAVNDYLSIESTVVDVLLASKAIEPLQYDNDAAEGVLEILRNQSSIRADRLLTALGNWLVFEAEIGRIVSTPSVRGSDHILTLGGEDERVLWDVWHRGCPGDLSARVQHIFLRPMPTPRDQTWEESALTARTDRARLDAYLRKRTATDGHSDLIEWLVRSAISLPASLNPGFRDRLDPVLTDVDAVQAALHQDVSHTVRAVAKAVVEWFTA